MKKFNVTQLVKIAAVAAIYFVLTVALPLSFGQIQFRFSEILVLLCFYDKKYCYSMVAGCALANLFSPMAAVDVPFGTAATLIAVLCICFFGKKLWIAATFPVVANGIIVAIELNVFFGLPLFLSMGTVAFGEAVVLALGVFVFKLLEKNKSFMKLIS